MTLEQFVFDILLPKSKTEIGLVLIDLLGISYITVSDIDGLFNVYTHGVIAASVSFGLFLKVHAFFKNKKKDNYEKM